MNYTTNYHLPQWVETDRIQMEDFNGAMSDIDQGIKTAQDTAETAQANASAAQTAATAVADAYTPDNKPYVVGSYSANGSGVTVELGFKPSLVIISGERYSTDTEDMMLYTVIATADSPGMVIEFTNTGFRTLGVGSYAPYLCDKRAYRYIPSRKKRETPQGQSPWGFLLLWESMVA